MNPDIRSLVDSLSKGDYSAFSPLFDKLQELGHEREINLIKDFMAESNIFSVNLNTNKFIISRRTLVGKLKRTLFWLYFTPEEYGDDYLMRE